MNTMGVTDVFGKKKIKAARGSHVQAGRYQPKPDRTLIGVSKQK